MKGIIVAAIKMAPRKDWEEHFDSEIRQLEARLTGTPDAELGQLKAKVAEMMVQKQKFLSAFDK